MKKFLLSFLLFFGLFEMAHATNLFSGRTIYGVTEEFCQRAILNVARPFNPQARLKLEIMNKFAQYGHRVSHMPNSRHIMPNSPRLDDDVYLNGIVNLSLALERGIPVTRHSRNITGIVMSTNNRRIRIFHNPLLGGLQVHISVHTPVEEIVPEMNLALLKHEIKRRVHHYGPSFIFVKGFDVDDERLASFLETTFLRALEDDKDAARIIDFPDDLSLRIIDERNLGVDFRSAFYNGSDIFVSADAPAESLFHRLSNVLLEKQVTDWMWEHYAYRGRSTGSAVINNGVDDTAYERGLKIILKWFDDSFLVRKARYTLARLGRIYVTENQLEIRPRSLSDDETVFDIYVPSNVTEVYAETLVKLLPPAE